MSMTGMPSISTIAGHELMKESCSLQGMYGRFYHLEYMKWPEDYQDQFIEEMDKAGVDSLFDYVMFMEA